MVENDAEQGIKDYLRAHPDFFNRHLDLLESLRIPHPCRPAVSLLERQLSLYRDQNAQLGKRLRELVAVARDNDFLSRHMQCLALELIESPELSDMLEGIQSVMREKFGVDFTALRIAAVPAETDLRSDREFVRREALTPFDQVLRSGRPYCGALSDEQIRLLFQDTTPYVGSVALVPLRGADWQGLLALGSRDRKRFYSAKGTLFLTRMGELISHALQRHLHPLSELANY